MGALAKKVSSSSELVEACADVPILLFSNPRIHHTRCTIDSSGTFEGVLNIPNNIFFKNNGNYVR